MKRGAKRKEYNDGACRKTESLTCIPGPREATHHITHGVSSQGYRENQAHCAEKNTRLVTSINRAFNGGGGQGENKTYYISTTEYRCSWQVPISPTVGPPLAA
ncbi:hypothetical protein QTP88_001410 [Uroleucon formosanum]